MTYIFNFHSFLCVMIRQKIVFQARERIAPNVDLNEYEGDTNA